VPQAASRSPARPFPEGRRRSRTARLLGASLTLALFLVPGHPRAEEPAAAAYALTPPAAGGLESVDRLLRKLGTHRRLLVVGAHPDDEDTQLLALVSQGMGGEAAYLSLSRGEGGQNLVGPDLGVGLGLVRSQELCAARRLDGGRQFFTRAYDFGFTRSLDETLQKWPKQILLEDAVRIIRRFRPQVVVSIFSGTARDGHGQHQAAGLTAQESFRAAGDAAALGELAAEGLTPWQAAALYRETGWFDKESTTIVLPTGGTDPLTGRSYYQIAMASRSLHRSQDMGRLQEPWPQDTSIGWVAGGAGKEGKDLFAGIDTRLRAIAAEAADPGRRAEMEKRLDRVETLTAESRRRLSSPDVASIVPLLAEALAELRAARALVGPGDGGVGMLLDEKIALAGGALAGAAGVTLDVLAEREVSAPGESFEVTVDVWNAGGGNVTAESVTLVSPDGWTSAVAPAGRPVAAGKLEEWKSTTTVPRDARPTLPYFLYRPLMGSLYDWSGTPAAVRGEPFAPAPLRASVLLTIGGTKITLARDAAFRLRDEAIGEIRRPVRAAPALDAAVEPHLLVWPAAHAEKRVEVTLTSNTGAPIAGRVEIAPPAGWSVPAPRAFSFAKRGERQFVDVPLAPPASLPAGRYRLSLAAVLDDGRRMDLGVRTIDYGYIPRTPMPEPAEVAISAADIRLPKLSRVGYVRGAADQVPEALLAVGVPIEILTERDLDAGDLSHYDVILVGSRAYETDPALPRANGRLLDYARSGGLVIVQYQQYGFIQSGFAPFSLEIARPHDRVTDETAAVTVLDPKNPIFTTPNAIGPSDWDGWVQERGLYYAHTWAPEYAALLSMADPGGPTQKGGLLVARLGKGRYVYTGLAFFRQLPAGVPGAYRLFANLLALK
jgi:LmbE family N-acetylglucosaminyl deacetylase